jgi:hypothetical protein
MHNLGINIVEKNSCWQKLFLNSGQFEFFGRYLVNKGTTIKDTKIMALLSLDVYNLHLNHVAKLHVPLPVIIFVNKLTYHELKLNLS